MTGTAFSADGKRLATGGDRILRVWDVGSWKEVLARDDVASCWVGFGPDPDIDEVYDHLIRLMQDTLDALAAERRFPVLG